MTTRHTCNAGHGPVFGRRTVGCARCDELAKGAAPVRWASARKADELRKRLAEIRAHDCKRCGCGPVCTAFDW